MLVSHQERPRELKWYHAGPLLYGDLGTSRFYVLGLAFYYALFSSFWYILAVGLLVLAVGWAYTVVCRAYPDGGGVYSAARQISPVLSVVGALLLFADYAVTAALSAFDGMHYLGLANDRAVQVGACAAVVLLGVINYIGPKRAGAFALLVAAATLVLTLILVAFAVPHLSVGYAAMQPMHGSTSHKWTTFAAVVLALSGIEAVANMTGIMVHPVARTAKKSIWPVLAEVVLFNLVLGVAMLGLPAALEKVPVETVAARTTGEFSQPASHYEANDRAIGDYRKAHRDWDQPTGQAGYEAFAKQHEPHSSVNEEAIKNKVLRVMGEQYVHPWFGAVAGVVFGLLLLSAVNTVIGGMISVAYVMSRDQELPGFFKQLNLFGVPWVGLVPAVVIPVVLLLIFTELEQLADLYAIGVVGAIAINLTSCTINRKLAIRTWERLAIGAIAAFMIAIEITLAMEKWHALVFVTIILVAGLATRFVTKTLPEIRARAKAVPAGAGVAPVLAEAKPVEVTALGTPAEQLDMSKPHVMVATRGGPRLLDFAATYTKQIGGILFVIYVRPFNVQFAPAGMKGPTLAEDPDAMAVFRGAAEACRKTGVPMVPIYAVSADVADAILDFAGTYGVQSLLMGVSRKGTLLKALQGDVLTTVAENLPQDIPLLIHA